MYAPQPQPRQINALSDFTVTKVACGQNHTLALTKEGQAFTWGEDLAVALMRTCSYCIAQSIFLPAAPQSGFALDEHIFLEPSAYHWCCHGILLSPADSSQRPLQVMLAMGQVRRPSVL